MRAVWIRVASYLHSEERGASLVEYALLLVLIAVVAIVVITQVGENTSGTFSEVNDGLK